MKHKAISRWGTLAPALLTVLYSSAAWGDLLAENVFIGVSGGGLIFADPEEGIEEPGLKSVTFTRTRVPNGSGGFDFVDPFEVIITDFSPLSSRGEATNCLMANKVNVVCDSEGGSGKRIKTQLTGTDPLDIRLRTTPSATYPSVDYFTFGKTSNFTGARLAGFSVQLLDANGNPMRDLAPEDAVLFNLQATALGIGARLPDGLFGAGGQEGNIGFFSSDRAVLARTASSDTLEFGALSNAEYVANFGTGFLDDSQVPDGLFWDDNGNPADESALVAWDNIAGGGWTYGTIGTAAEIDATLQKLAADLGVTVADLGYSPGAQVPEAIVTAAQANGLFEAGAIEDLRNANLNYTFTVGDIAAGEFIWRITPVFVPIVASAETDYQFQIAADLDGFANIPYLDRGNATEYQDAITRILALDPSKRGTAIESIGYSFAPAFVSLGFEAARNQVNLVDNWKPWATGTSEGVVAQNATNSWEFGEGFYGLVDLSGVTADYDPTPGSVGYDIDMGTFSLGMEKRINTNTSVGAMFSASNGSADAQDNLGSVDVDAYSIVGFLRHGFLNGLRLNAVIGYQDLSYESERNVLGRKATASPDGSQWFAALNADYMIEQSPGFRFGPTASAGYYDASVDGFTESGAGAFNLDVDGQDVDTLLGSIGIRSEYEIPSLSGGGLLTGSLEYAFVDETDVGTRVGFIGLPAYDVPGQALDDEWVSVRLGFETSLPSVGNSSTVLRAGYGGAIGSDSQSHSLNIGLSYQF